MSSERTIAVLPFRDLEGGEETWFTRGFAEDVVTELGRFAQLEVVHPRSSFSVEGTPTDRDLGHELGARYLLRGSVRRSGESLIVSAQLVEAASGRQTWAERFDAPGIDAPAVQVDIACRVASSLAVEIDKQRLSRARRRPLAQLEVYDCWLRGLEHLREGTLEADDKGRELFERALELDPHFARAHAGISLSHFNEWSCRAWERWDETEQRAFEAARRARELDASDHVIHLILGRIELYRRRFDAAERHLALALEINPNDADALVQISIGKAYLGDPEGALALIDKALRLNPLHDDWYYAYRMYSLFAAGRYEEAIVAGERGGSISVDGSAFLAASHALLGRLEPARAKLRRFLEEFRERVLFGREPELGEPVRWILHVNPYRDEARLGPLKRGLALAGLAEDPDQELVEDDAGASAVATSRSRAVFRSEIAFWTATWVGRSVRLQPVKGFQDLATLLAQPGERMHCLELAGRPAPGDRGDPVLDREGRERLRSAAHELQQELDEAERDGDPGRAERARAELDRLVATLSAALGIGGRARRLGCGIEKARTAVTWRIKSAIRKILAAHPGLGRHLSNSVRTGTYCVYEPESPVSWEL